MEFTSLYPFLYNNWQNSCLIIINIRYINFLIGLYSRFISLGYIYYSLVMVIYEKVSFYDIFPSNKFVLITFFKFSLSENGISN